MTGVLNGDGTQPTTGLGGAALPTGTGAPGSPGITASETQGPVVGSPGVVGVYQSSQLAYPHLDVTSGDTSASSADGPVPPGGDPLTGLSMADITMTGAGGGNPDPYTHPNAGGRA